MKRLRVLLGLLLGSLVLSGCNFDVYSLPLPGGTDVGDNPIRVSAQFQDVLDLVPKSTVKVNDVAGAGTVIVNAVPEGCGAAVMR